MPNAALTKEQIIDHYVLTFDPDDKKNGSLYIGEPLNAESGIHLASALGELRSARVWSNAPEKQVPEAHRAVYREQLTLVEAIAYRNASGEFIIARFDHSKFPSDEGRWLEWQNYFDGRYARA